MVVRDVDDGSAGGALQPTQLDAQLLAQLGVERGQRLVHQEHARPAHQRPADRHALHLAAGQGRGLAVQLAFDVQHLGHLPHAARDLRRVGAPQRRAQREGQVVEHREMRVERVLLEHEGAVAPGGQGVGDVVAIHADAAGIGAFQPCHEAQRGRLAGAAGPEDDEKLAIGHGESELAHRAHRAEGAADAGEVNAGHGACLPGGAASTRSPAASRWWHRRARCARYRS